LVALNILVDNVTGDGLTESTSFFEHAVSCCCYFRKFPGTVNKITVPGCCEALPFPESHPYRGDLGRGLALP